MFSMEKIERQAKKMIEIRTFEETILRLFSENKLSGTTHTCIGQEATAVGIMEHIAPEDKVFSNHRCHGHYLAYGGPMESLLAEIMSRESGLCQGRGGSQHIHYRNFYSNGVQGGIVPNAVGMAWADRLHDEPGVTVVFIGDGTLGQGLVYESFNMASLYECPVLFVIEDNGYAMSTPRDKAVSGEIALRPAAFGIETAEITSNDVEELDLAFAAAFAYVRTHRKPFCQIVHNYRLAAHSKGDDVRDAAEIEAWRKKDPIVYIEEKAGRAFCDQCRQESQQKLDALVQKLEVQPWISIDDYTAEYVRQRDEDLQMRRSRLRPQHFFSDKNDRVLTAIHDVLETKMETNPELLLLGEDICDPYGGAFKVTKGLSTLYPQRVINTPISEAAMAGVSVGLALNHVLPVVEIMFGDFVSLCFDQLLNHAGKYGWVYGDGVKVPAIYRIPSGGGRGYGPTHSQSLEKYLIGIPMITVVALTQFLDVRELYGNLVDCCQGPLVIVENKKMYTERMRVCEDGRIGDFRAQVSALEYAPMLRLSLDETSQADAVLVTYGGMVQTALDAAQRLMIEEEIQLDVIVMTQLAPFPAKDFEAMFLTEKYGLTEERAARIGTLEEGNLSGGIGEQVIACLAERGIGRKYFRIASKDIPIPNGIALESQMIPTVDEVVRRVKESVELGRLV